MYKKILLYFIDRIYNTFTLAKLELNYKYDKAFCKKDECVSFVSLSVEYWKSSWNMSDIVKSWFLGNSKKKFVLLTIFRCEYLYSCLINLDLLSLEVWCTVLWNLEKYLMKNNGFFIYLEIRTIPLRKFLTSESFWILAFRPKYIVWSLNFC